MTDKQIIIDEINKTIEQEMENLRNIAKQQIGKLEAKLKAKEQECEELKKYIKHLHNLCGNETDKQYKLKQTLTKIKEICNNNDELKGDFNLVDCDKYKLGKHNLANRILQKISECEGNDEKH